MKNPHSFETSDTALAAYLHTCGFQLEDVITVNFPAIFVFKNSDKELEQAVHDYQAGKAEGNIAIFFMNYKRMLARLKDGYRDSKAREK